MRANGVEAAIARYREAGTKKDARNRNCVQMASAYLGVLLCHEKRKIEREHFHLWACGK